MRYLGVVQPCRALNSNNRHRSPRVTTPEMQPLDFRELPLEEMQARVSDFVTALRRRRIGNSVVMKTITSQKQRDLLSEVYLNHGMAGVSDLREKLGSSDRLELEAATLGTVVLAGESEFRIPPAYYSAASLEEAEALSRDDDDGLVADTEFQERLELFLQELSASKRLF